MNTEPTIKELRDALQAMVSEQDAGKITFEAYKKWEAANTLLSRFKDHPDNPHNVAERVRKALDEANNESQD